MNDKINIQSTKPEIITSGDIVKISGYYIFDGHVGESCNSYIPFKAKEGLYLAEGSKAPTLDCQHWIRWKLI